MSAPDESAALFTQLQGQYLAFIRAYTVIHRRPPAEADMQAFIRVTPPSVHQMILKLEQRGLIQRTPGAARSLRLLVKPEQLPISKTQLLRIADCGVDAAYATRAPSTALGRVS